MSASALLRAALVAMGMALGGCGGAQCDAVDLVFGCGRDEEADEEPAPPELRISQPATTGSFVTSAEEVRIAGTTSDPDARIYWSNNAGGQGETSPESDFCIFDCEYDWGMNVALAMGYNLITVVAAGDGGTTTTAIAITRQAQWSWVR